MKLTKEIENGILLFFGIGIFFLIIEFLGLSQHYYLRALNFIIVVFCLNRLIKYNLVNNKKGFYEIFFSCCISGFIGISIGIIGLAIYLSMKGGDLYVKQLSQSFLLGNDLSIIQYCLALFIEGIASILIVSYINVQYWRLKKEVKEDFV